MVMKTVDHQLSSIQSPGFNHCGPVKYTFSKYLSVTMDQCCDVFKSQKLLASMKFVFTCLQRQILNCI